MPISRFGPRFAEISPSVLSAVRSNARVMCLKSSMKSLAFFPHTALNQFTDLGFRGFSVHYYLQPRLLFS